MSIFDDIRKFLKDYKPVSTPVTQGVNNAVNFLLRPNYDPILSTAGKAIQSVAKNVSSQGSLVKPISITSPSTGFNPYRTVTEAPRKVFQPYKNFAFDTLSSTISDIGKTTERLGSTAGRKELTTGASNVPSQISRGDFTGLLDNPAIVAAMALPDVSDIAKSGLKVGAKNLSKESTKKALSKALIGVPSKKEIIKKIAINPTDFLNTVSIKQSAKDIIDLDPIDPSDLFKNQYTSKPKENTIKLEAGLDDLLDPTKNVKAVERETIERVFKESGKGKDIAKGLLGESYAQTKFRRNLGLKPEDVYQTTKDVQQQFRALSRVTPSNVIGDVKALKDISSTEKGFKDVYRIFEKVFKGQYPAVKKSIIEPFNTGKKYYVDMVNEYSNQLQKNVISLGIKKGSKESAAVQLFGEGKLNPVELIDQFGKEKAAKITQADRWFRKTYNELIDTVNATRRQLYPGKPDMIIPFRKDYYRHFQELSGIEGLKNIFENSAGIDPKFVGLSDYTLPRSKWLSFAQRRTGDNTTYDAVGGFLDYLPKAAYASQIDPHTLMFRKLANEVVQKTGQADQDEYKTMNNFIEFLEDYANDLAGKTNPLDRGIQKYIPGGRKTFRIIDWANKRVKANTILGNASSSVAQIFNVPQGIASAGEKNFIAGLYDTVLSPLKKTHVIDESGFIAERYINTTQFDRGIVNNAKKFAVWMTGVLDEFGTKSIWNAHYKKALSENIENPVQYADEFTRKLVGGRGIGEVPMVQKSKVFQLVAPFQLEVGNLWNVMGDFVGEKRFDKLAKLLVYNYLFNSVSEKVVGRRITFDPINALTDSITDDEGEVKPLDAAGRLTGEVLSNIPFGQTVAAAYPEQGFSVGETQFPTRKKLFGESDPTRFGGGLLVGQGVQDPLYKLLPPFGGAQAKKTIQGIKSFQEGQSLTPTGRKRFNVEQTPGNLIKSAILGQYSTKGGQEYIQNLGKSKGEVLYKSLKQLSPEAAAAKAKLLKENDPDAYRALIDYKTDRTLKITSHEKNIRNLTVRDGSRARTIVKVINGKKTAQEKAEAYKRFKELGIITEDIEKQLMAARQAGAFK